MPKLKPYIAFAGLRRIATGDLPHVARALSEYLSEGGTDPLAVFETASSSPVDLDLRGSADDAARWAENWPAMREVTTKSGPGRPRLGVVAREVTLLPRHWDWLSAQPGSASVTLRKLVDAARRQNHESERIRHRQDVAYRFMAALAGDLPGFEEAIRALYAWDLETLEELARPWPEDLREHLMSILEQGEGG